MTYHFKNEEQDYFKIFLFQYIVNCYRSFFMF